MSDAEYILAAGMGSAIRNEYSASFALTNSARVHSTIKWLSAVKAAGGDNLVFRKS